MIDRVPKKRGKSSAQARPNPTGAPWSVETSLRHGLALYQFIRHLRGGLTVEQLKKLAKLLESEAYALYRTADRIERKPKIEIVGKRSVESIRAKLGTRGFVDDTVAKIVLIRITKPGITEPKTPHEFRRLAMALMNAAEYVRGAHDRYLEWAKGRQLEETGRAPNIALDGLLQFTTRLGLTDADVARALADAGYVPDGPGFDDPDPAERWAALIKSTRC